MGEVSAKNRRLVYERDEHQCTARGQLPGQCWGHLDIGHIIGRGMGGSDLHDEPDWLLAQCRRHNGLIEDAVGEVRELIRRLGMQVSRYNPPERAEVRYPDGVWYTLTKLGTKERIERHDGLEIHAEWMDEAAPGAGRQLDGTVRPLWPQIQGGR